jgi:hypothetical protein
MLIVTQPRVNITTRKMEGRERAEDHACGVLVMGGWMCRQGTNLEGTNMEGMDLEGIFEEQR